MTPIDSASNSRRAARVVLIAIVAAGFAARLFSALATSFHADEVSTLLAAEGILETGLPKYPSGVIRTTGGPLLYLEAPLVGLFGYRESIVRLPSVLFSTASILAVFYFTRGLAGTHAGLLAALFVAGDPEAVQWGARAKCYGLVPLLVVATAWSTRRLARDGTLRQGMFTAACAGLMLWTHPLTVCLLPGLFVALVASSRWISRRHILVVLGIAALMVIAAAIWLRWIDPNVWRVMIRDGAPFHRPDAARLLYYIRANPLRFASACMAAMGLGSVAVSTVFYDGRLQSASRLREQLAWAACGVIGLLCLSSVRIWSPHHVLIVHPLIAIAGACSLRAGLAMPSAGWKEGRANAAQWCAIALLCGCVLLPRNDWQRVFSSPSSGLTEGYRFMAANWREGDLTLNANASVEAYLPEEKRAVYFSQRPYEGNLGRMRSGSHWIHRYLGVPCLSTADDLRRALDKNPRVWYVLSQRDWNTHLHDDARELIEAHMRAVYVSGQTRVFLKAEESDASAGDALATRSQKESSRE